MNRILLTASILCLFCFSSLQAQDRDVIAGIPVNYDESKTGDYTQGLPDLLTFANGKKVTRPAQWAKRRKEILNIVETNQFGKVPAKRPALRFDKRDDIALDGAALRRQVRLFFSPEDDSTYVDVLIYLPKDANSPVPLLLNLSFSPNNLVVDDPGVWTGRRWDPKTGKCSPAKGNGPRGMAMNDVIKKYLAEGYGFATLCYSDIEPDFLGGMNLGVRKFYLKEGQTEFAPDEWGAISAWSWGVSYVIDYMEKDKDIDAGRLALTGCSRLGKTTLWTGARDSRIAVVIPSCSGEGGAASSRRNFGETVAHLTAPTRYPYQFARNYAKCGEDVYSMPMDAHMLIALVAPRPVLLQTGLTDNWSDPKGEYYSATLASCVYELLGQGAFGASEFPEPEQPVFTTLGYVMHDGGHAVLPQDWDYYLQFIKRYL